jgi:ComF family protein
VVYDDFIKQFILRFKHGNAIQYAKIFAKLFYREDFRGADCVVPVPIHPIRLFKRTYNQAALLAFSLKKLYDDFPAVNIQIIKKNRYTSSQKKKKFQQRVENVANSFVVPDKHVKFVQHKTIVVLDDVVASGTTLLECKRVLEEAGAKEVRCVALARSYSRI